MACFLPQFILLKSSNDSKYLRYRKEDDSNHALLEFSQDEEDQKAEIHYVKFEVQKSETEEGFVHIRSCYNNKYWVRKCGDDESKSWIAVEANEPEEDSSKLSCTLFKPVLVDEQEEEFVEHDKPQKIRLVHVDQLGQQGCRVQANSDFLSLKDDGDEVVFTAFNASSVVLLPKFVAFKNHDGKYGALTTVWGTTYVDFNTSDIGATGVAISLYQETLAQPQFIICEHLSMGSFWRLADGGNVITVARSSSIQSFLSTPIMLTGNSIALRNYRNPVRFANCVSSAGLAHVVGCSASSIIVEAIFEVEEPVLRRQVSNVEYKLADARVYNVSSVDKFRDERRNNTSLQQTGTFLVEYTTTRTTTWSDSVSLTTSVTASMSVSVPYVGVDFGIELSEERNQTVVFGSEETESQTVAYSQDVTIPPGKKITMVVLATRALCDVPFSSRIVDTLSNGTVVEYTKTDGKFNGSNEFSFITELFEENL